MDLKWNLDLEFKPDFDKSMERIYAWYEGEIIDRAPIRFSAHNEEYNTVYKTQNWSTLEERWFDTEYQVDLFIEQAKHKSFLAETFPIYSPNLGPSWYAGVHGSPITWGEVTSWGHPIINSSSDIDKIKLDKQCNLYTKMKEMTSHALSKCKDKFMVGYTDLHPGIDCVATWRENQPLLFDFYDDLDLIKELLYKSQEHFFEIYDEFDSMLKSKNQLSAAWLNIPSFGKMHIPSADFASMISKDMFDEIVLPSLEYECKYFDHNVFHLDGKGVANHIDSILKLPKLNAIQWVQGVAEDEPIMQWIPLIKKILNSNVSILVDLKKSELKDFINEFDSPKGIMISISSSEEDEQKEIIKTIEKW